MVMTELEYREKLQRRLAQTTIGAQALRNQGAPGMVRIARNFCEQIDVQNFFDALPNQTTYNTFLNNHTAQLQAAFLQAEFPVDNFGAARKVLNLFVRELVYNGYFSSQYHLPTEYAANNHAISNLEIPLDRDVANGIRDHFNGPLPEFPGIRRLTPEVHRAYQQAAEQIASEDETARIHLDMRYYRAEPAPEAVV
jgi:hypothetical protein